MGSKIYVFENKPIRVQCCVAFLQLQLFYLSLCRTKQKQMKLKKYLKEICERQKESLLRNQDLLKEFDHIEAHIGECASKLEALQKLKVLCTIYETILC